MEKSDKGMLFVANILVRFWIVGTNAGCKLLSGDMLLSKTALRNILRILAETILHSLLKVQMDDRRMETEMNSNSFDKSIIYKCGWQDYLVHSGFYLIF